MSHSIIPPSSAGIWGAQDGCTGWVLMNLTYPETEQSTAAAEGEAAHQIAAEMVEHFRQGRAGGGPLSWSGYEGRAANNGVMFDEGMHEAAEVYAADVGRVIRTRGVFSADYVKIETQRLIPSIHAEAYGTPDCTVYDAGKMEFIIWDFKYGFEVVEAYENWQLICYAAGLIDELLPKMAQSGIDDTAFTFRLVAVQPRAYHRQGPVREWAVTGAQLRGYVNILHANAEKALGPNATFNTGPHCKHCPGRHACPAALQAGFRLFEAATQALPVELPPAALGVQLALVGRARRQLEYLETGYHEQAKALMRSGRDVPGWIQEPTYGRKKWIAPAGDVAALGDMMGVDLRKPVDVVTPNQAVKKGVDETVITAYCETPRTGFKIAPDNGNKAKQVFEA
jgi:hypothetical protein